MNVRRLAFGALLLTILVAGGSGTGSRTAYAQTGDGDWRTIASGDEILALAIDPGDGRTLYAGTEGGGLVVWDDASGDYEQYLFPTQPGLPSNDVRDIAFDALDQPWLATSAGVVKAVGNEWRTFGTADGLPSLDITTITVGLDGEIWAGTYADGVARLEEGSDTWEVFEGVEFVPDQDDEVKDGPGEWHILDIAVSPTDGRVWVAHGRQATIRPAYSVYDVAEDGWFHITAATPGASDPDGPPSDQILAVAFDDEGRLWSGSWREGVLRYDFDLDEWQQWTDLDGVCGPNVWDVSIDGEDVWVACASGSSGSALGAAHWAGAGWTPWSQYDSFNEETGIPTDDIRAVAVAYGVGYLGTNGPGATGSGIAVVEDDEVREVLTTAPTAPQTNDITALTFDPATGDLWVGTRDSGLMQYDGATWEQHTFDSTGELLRGDTVTDLLVADDVLWVATTQVVVDGSDYLDGGVSAYDLIAAEWLEPLHADNSDLPDNDVSSLALDSDGRLWIGMGQATGSPGETLNSGNGVAVYDRDLESFDEYFVYNGPGVELPGETVLDIAGYDQEIWVGSSYAFVSDRREGGGAGQYAGGAWSSWGGGEDGFRTYHGSGDPEDKDPFITGDVRAVAIGRDGEVYAGTWDLDTGSLGSVWPYVDAVVNRWDGDVWVDEAFLGDGWVSSLVEDSDGRIWAGTTRGHDESENVQEVDLLTKRRTDTASGGAYVWDGLDWTHLTPRISGLANNAITAMAVDPATGYVWLGFENAGLSVYESGEPVATPTICVDCPTPTPRPTQAPQNTTGPMVMTSPPLPTDTAAPGMPTSTSQPGGEPWPTPDPDEPEPPPEVPEPATLLLVGAGLAGIAGYAALRRRRHAEE